MSAQILHWLVQRFYSVLELEQVLEQACKSYESAVTVEK
jgi:hypothetical protein